jgi:hypothetical protein
MHQRFTLFATVAAALSVVSVSRAQTPVRNVDLISNWPAPLYWQPPASNSEGGNIHRARIRESAVEPMAASQSTIGSPALFVAMVPCRVVNTRDRPAGPFGGPAFAGGETRTYAFPSSPDCPNIPVSAVAYSVNIAVLPQPTGSPMYWLTAWNAGAAKPLASTLNDYAGLITSNSAVVPTGIDPTLGPGSISVFVHDSTHVLIDINGYYLASDAHSNTAIGGGALSKNTGGKNNTAVGYAALSLNTVGNNNTAIGVQALAAVTGSNNFAIGYNAGNQVTGGSENVLIANQGDAADNGVIRIGDPLNQTTTFISGIHGVTTGNAAIPVVVDGNGQLGTASSSRSTKQDIEDMGDTTGTIMSLHPVRFHYKAWGPDSEMQYGLVAEDVAEVAPDLVARTPQGEIMTVYYDKVNAMVLHQVQEQQRLIEKQNALIQQLESRIAELENRDQ